MPNQNGVWLIKKSFDYYVDKSKVLIKMTSQKCQPRHGQKVHGPITMDMFKTICPKWLRGFFMPVQNEYFSPKFIVKKIRNSNSVMS